MLCTAELNVTKAEAKELRKKLIEYYGKEWWNETLKFLKEEFDYPSYREVPEHQLDDFHPVFRPYVKTLFNLNNETSASKYLISLSRRNDLLHCRVSLLPQYFTVFCPVFRSRSIGNFGLVNMLPDDAVFSRAFYNIPFPFHQKPKRTVISCYGLTKHGKNVENVDLYPHGGVFLLKPDPDPEWEKYARYTDYAYVTLNWRFPKTYDEFIKTLDGSVLLSHSAAEKLKYKRIAYAIINNPSKDLVEKRFFILSTKVPKKGVRVEYQQPLTSFDSDLSALASAVGVITDVECLNPLTKDPEKKIWKLKIEDKRKVEIGCKIESPHGIKHTVAGYTNDKEPTIIINPDAFKDRGIYEEIKKTGKIHCYPTIPGMDGNISTKNIRISKTLVQGIFCYPPKVQKEIINAIFNEKILVNPFPSNVLSILENMAKIDPEKLVKKYPVFYNLLYFTRTKKVNDKVYYYVEPTKTMRAWKELNKVKDYSKLNKMYQKALDDFVNLVVRSILLLDTEKKCKIKIRGFIRIVLFHSNPNVDEIHISPKLHEKMGKPEYVLFAKEPVTRDLSIRCLKVKVKKDVPEWVCCVHPYLAMDHEKDELHTKLDSVAGDTPVWVKNPDGSIECLPISSLLPEPVKDMERIPVNKQVWTAKGWVPIAYVYRHKVNKEGYEIRTTAGYVKVTDDHSLIVKDHKVKPSDVHEVEITRVPLPNDGFDNEELAWLYGLFLAEGNVYFNYRNGKYHSSVVRIKMTDKNVLEKAKKILEKHGYSPVIEPDYRKCKYGKEALTLIISRYRNEALKWKNWFYVGKAKKVPTFILTATKRAKRVFIEGLVEGDGHVYNNGKIEISTIYLHVANAVQRILEDLGYIVSICPDKSAKNKFSKRWVWKVRTLPSGKKKYLDEHIIGKKRIKFDDEYVYDICTYANEFSAFNIRLSNTDGDLALLIPLDKKIDGAMYNKKIIYKKLWKENKNVTLDTVKHFEPYKDLFTFITDVYEYNRRESIEQLLMQTFGGLKNRAMFTDLIKDYKTWKNFVLHWDIELRGFQADKLNPELKDATPKELNEFYEGMLKEALSYQLPDYDLLYKEYRELENVTYENRHEVRKTLKKLKKSKHPVLKLLYRIYKTLKIV